MNWKEEAKKELQMYEALKSSVINVQERLKWCEAQKTSVQSANTGTVPIQGGGSRYEDRLLDLIVQADRLRLTLNANRIRLKLIERGLAALSKQDRLILTVFAENKPGDAVEILSEKLYLERAQIYRLWNAALYRFTIAEYGIPEY